jgi:hypothetical protein
LLAEPLLEPPDKKIHMHLEDTVLVTPQVDLQAWPRALMKSTRSFVNARLASINKAREKFASLVRLMVFNTQGV